MGIQLDAETNLALGSDVSITISLTRPTGGGARSAQVLLNETACYLDGRPLADFGQEKTFDTYDGQNLANGLDWYAIDFGSPTTFNCLEMTMGFAYRDGGWWTSLNVEVRLASDDDWLTVSGLAITPNYNFANARAERRPYEAYVLTFNEITAVAVRVIGQSGGLAQFTSLARLAVYHRELSHWNRAAQTSPPIPYVFQLISPQIIWDLSENLSKVTGLSIDFQLIEFYLDEVRYKQFWKRIGRNYQGEPDLWFLVGDVVGWDTWNRLNRPDERPRSTLATEPIVRISFHDTLASAFAPILINNQVIGQITTYQAILKDTFDWDWHRRHAEERGIAWTEYQAAIDRSPHMTLEQLEGVAGLMGMIANTIANLVHRNLSLEHELNGARQTAGQRALQRKEIVRRAIDFMQENLESSIGIPEVAACVALSVPYFCTLFTEQTGRNPSDVLIDLRLERAREYLAHTTMSVMDVCVALDYSPSYFSRLFKRRMGCTPGQYAHRMRSR